MNSENHKYSSRQEAWSKQCTAELRSSPSPRWQRVRARLSREDVDPADAAVSEFGPDEATSAWGLIVTRDERIFEFLLEFDSVASMDETSEVQHWWELNAADLRGIYAQGWELGCDLLKRD